MKKLIKPGKAVEDYSDDRVEAFCEFGCGFLCMVVCPYNYGGGSGNCGNVGEAVGEDDVLF